MDKRIRIILLVLVSSVLLTGCYWGPPYPYYHGYGYDHHDGDWDHDHHDGDWDHDHGGDHHDWDRGHDHDWGERHGRW